MSMGMFKGTGFIRTPDGTVHGLNDNDLIGCLGKSLCEVEGAREVETVVEADACHDAGCSELFDFHDPDAGCSELFDFHDPDAGTQPPQRMVECDHCGYKNPPDALNCRNCNHPTRDT